MADTFNYLEYKSRLEAINALLKKGDFLPDDLDGILEEVKVKSDAMLKFLLEKKRRAADING